MNDAIKTDTPLYQLKITLKDIHPPIWRRLHVPGELSLEFLHLVIQAVMPWLDYHLHHFQKGETLYGISTYEDDLEYVDSRETELSTVLVSKGDQVIYEYDFGDNWQHEIVLEEILQSDPEAPYLTCIAGERACPPEDCGGPTGYALMLQALADPAHEEHEIYAEWLGGTFDAEIFDLAETNTNLRLLLEEPTDLMRLVNRYCAVIKPRQPMVDWIKVTTDLPNYTLEKAQQECTTVLLPEIEEPSALHDLLRALKPVLFDRELAAWYREPSVWPQQRSAELFDEWFHLELHSMVWDLAWDEPLLHE